MFFYIERNILDYHENIPFNVEKHVEPKKFIEILSFYFILHENTEH